MNKLDEIARRVWKDVCKSSSVGESLAVKYASALLAELSKDAKPIGWWNGKETAFFEHETDGPVGEVNIPLFTRPIPANTAEIEQRVVEACKKAVLSEHLEYVTDSDGAIAYDNAIDYAANAISKWREYL